ncbi:hypothetical protein ACLOJK_019446 [Asimina triloba]
MDVSKKDFVPCPKVDSSVVTIHPKSEDPNVDLNEWRAFTRTCFSKKNRTLGAILKHKKKVMELLHVSQTQGKENGNIYGDDDYSYDDPSSRYGLGTNEAESGGSVTPSGGWGLVQGTCESRGQGPDKLLVGNSGMN